jgi:hypothetical protein
MANQSSLYSDPTAFDEGELEEYKTVTELAAEQAAESGMSAADATIGAGGVITTAGLIPWAGAPVVAGVGVITSLTGLVLKYVEMQKNAETQAEFMAATLALQKAQNELSLAKAKEEGKQRAAMNMANIISQPS